MIKWTIILLTIFCNILNFFGQNIQKFTIDNKSDTTIFGQKGTRIFIPKDIFISQNGLTYKKSIILELIELYNLQELLTNDLSTSINQSLVNCKGIINFKIRGLNNNIEFRDGKCLIYHFPHKINDNGNSNIRFFCTNNLMKGWDLPDDYYNVYCVWLYWMINNYHPEHLIPLKSDTSFSSKVKGINIESIFPLCEYLNQNLIWTRDDLINLIKLSNKTIGISYINNKTGYSKISIKRGLTSTFNSKLLTCLLKFDSVYSQKPDWKKIEVQRDLELYPAIRNKVNIHDSYYDDMQKKYSIDNEKPNIDNNIFYHISHSYYKINSQSTNWLMLGEFYQMDTLNLMTISINSNKSDKVKIVFQNKNVIINGIYKNNLYCFNVPKNEPFIIVGIRRLNDLILYAVTKVEKGSSGIYNLNYNLTDLQSINRDIKD